MHHHFIDRYARQDSVVHRLDARTKLVIALVYSGFVVSVSRYDLAPLVPLAVLPFAWVTLGRIPWPFVARQILVCSPFILTLAVFNPLFDHSVQRVVLLGRPVEVAGGVLVAANLVFKFLLGVTCLIALSSTTRFDQILAAMRWFHVPQILVMQMHFLYRYLFELIGQSQELLRARSARDLGGLTLRRRMQSSAGMVGVLFVRSYESAGKVFQAMQARLYDGRIPAAQSLAFGRSDLAAVALAAAYLAFCYGSAR